MEISIGMNDEGYIKFKKTIDKLKQAGCFWNEKINKTLLEFNFERLKSEPSIHILKDKYKKYLVLLRFMQTMY